MLGEVPHRAGLRLRPGSAWTARHLCTAPRHQHRRRPRPPPPRPAGDHARVRRRQQQCCRWHQQHCISCFWLGRPHRSACRWHASCCSIGAACNLSVGSAVGQRCRRYWRGCRCCRGRFCVPVRWGKRGCAGAGVGLGGDAGGGGGAGCARWGGVRVDTAIQPVVGGKVRMS